MLIFDRLDAPPLPQADDAEFAMLKNPPPPEVDTVPPAIPIPEISHKITPRKSYSRKPPPPTVDDRERVYAVSPTGRRCLMTLTELISVPHGAVGRDPAQYPADVALCHGLPKSMVNARCRSLEWIFGLEAGELNVNSRYNLILLRMDVHHWFDNLGFILLPADKHIWNAIEELIKHNEKCTSPLDRMAFTDRPILNQVEYNYRAYVVHLPECRTLTRPIFEGPDKGKTSTHPFPFRDTPFQTLRSHFNPLYALGHARIQLSTAIAKKLIDIHGNWIEQEEDDDMRQCLRAAWSLTRSWFDTEQVPELFMRAKPQKYKNQYAALTKPRRDKALASSSREGRSRGTISVTSASTQLTQIPVSITNLQFNVTVPTSRVLDVTSERLRSILKKFLGTGNGLSVVPVYASENEDNVKSYCTRSTTNLRKGTGSFSGMASTSARAIAYSSKGVSSSSRHVAKKTKLSTGAGSASGSRSFNGSRMSASSLQTVGETRKRVHPPSSPSGPSGSDEGIVVQIGARGRRVLDRNDPVRRVLFEQVEHSPDSVVLESASDSDDPMLIK